MFETVPSSPYLSTVKNLTDGNGKPPSALPAVRVLLSVAPPEIEKIAPYSVRVDTYTENFPDAETEKYLVSVVIVNADVN